MCGMNMDWNMDVQHGHEAWTWTCTMDMEMDKHHGCRNANKKFSPASLVLTDRNRYRSLNRNRYCLLIIIALR
jgi:hypothetical protein